MKTLKALIRNEDGATLIEYSLLTGLIAIATIGAITLVGGNLSVFFNALAGKIAQINPG